MFHGTWFCHPKDILTETKSLDWKYGSEDPNDSKFGLGNYFAYKASYSNAGYTFENKKTKEMCMIIVWVCPGWVTNNIDNLAPDRRSLINFDSYDDGKDVVSTFTNYRHYC